MMGLQLIQRLQRNISQLYYHHGQFCSNHPVLIILSCIIIILTCCYPLLFISMPKNAPFDYATIPLQEFHDHNSTGYTHSISSSGRLGFVLQIVVSIFYPNSTSRENPNVKETESAMSAHIPAFFKRSIQLHQLVQEHQVVNTSNDESVMSLQDVCYTVDHVRMLSPHSDISVPSETVSSVRDSDSSSLSQIPLPQFSCLLISPGLYWELDELRLQQDWIEGGASRILHHLHFPALHANLRDILLGIPWRESGFSRLSTHKPGNNGVLSFAITLLLKHYDERFLSSLRARLTSVYPLSASLLEATAPSQVHQVFYKETNYLVAYAPLAFAYLVLLLYVYFSVRKIQMVKSKWGLAFSACFTVVSSLLMSIGVCVFTGLMPTLNGGEIFPYLVVLIGLENVLVITNAVVATPVDLPVKLRIAEGLSKESWCITKNLATELALLAVGFFTFNPGIQEFCLFAIVGLCCDFFLQMFFFVTVLSIDIRRMELRDLEAAAELYIHTSQRSQFTSPSFETPSRPAILTAVPTTQSQPPLRPANGNGNVNCPPPQSHIQGHKRKVSDMNTAAYLQSNGYSNVYVPRRLRISFFLSKTRMLKRVVAVILVCWVVILGYTKGVYSLLWDSVLQTGILIRAVLEDEVPVRGGHYAHKLTTLPTDTDWTFLEMVNLEALENAWKIMAYYHWPVLARFYNVSLAGRHLTVLPPLHVFHQLTHEEVQSWMSLRKPSSSAVGGEESSASGSASGENEGVDLLPASFLGWASLWHTGSLLVICVLSVTIMLSATYLIMCVLLLHQSRTRQHSQRSTGNTRRIQALVVDSGLQAVESVTAGYYRPLRETKVSSATCATSCDWWPCVACTSLLQPHALSVWRLSDAVQVLSVSRSILTSAAAAVPNQQTLAEMTPIWCLHFHEGVLLAGTASGVVEAWNLEVQCAAVEAIFVENVTGSMGVLDMQSVGRSQDVCLLSSHGELCLARVRVCTMGDSLREGVLVLHWSDTESQSVPEQETLLASVTVLRRAPPPTPRPTAGGPMMCCSEDLIATTSQGSLVHLYASRDLTHLRDIYTAQDSVLCLHLNQRHVSFGCANGSVHIHKLACQTEVVLQLQNGAEDTVATWIHRYGERLTLVRDAQGGISLWHDETPQKPLKTWTRCVSGGNAGGPAVLPFQAAYLVGDEDHSIRLVSVEQEKPDVCVQLVLSQDAEGSSSSSSSVQPVTYLEDPVTGGTTFVVSLLEDSFVVVPSGVFATATS